MVRERDACVRVSSTRIVRHRTMRAVVVVAVVVVASAVVSGRGAAAAACVEPKTFGGGGDDGETFRARAVALGIDLCVDSTDRARGANVGVDTSCDDAILSVACDVGLGGESFACAGTERVDRRRFRACVAPLCATSVCRGDDDDDTIGDVRASSVARAVCREACGASSRDLARFGASWQTSAFNPLNVDALLGSFASSYPTATSLVQSFLRVQATLWLLRSIYDAVVQSAATSSFGFATPTPTPTPTPPSTIYFPTPSSPAPPSTSTSPSPSPSAPSTCGVVVDSCDASCGLCIYPDAASDTPTCCCDATCVEYDDCCSDKIACCPSLSESKANARARSRSLARPRPRTAG